MHHDGVSLNGEDLDIVHFESGKIFTQNVGFNNLSRDWNHFEYSSKGVFQ